MQTAESDGPVQPVLVLDRAGRTAGAALTNTKGFNKSLENGVLWALDGSTGRLVPLTDLPGLGARVADGLRAAGRAPGARWIAGLEQGDGLAVVRADLELAPELAGAPALSAGAKPAPGAAAGPAAQAGTRPGAAAPAAHGAVSAVDAAQPDVAPGADARELAAFLLELQELIRGRKATLPEGSYTTHLFKAGLGKIRKKTGEEAIELLLAQTPEETVAEASDLVYHVLVLLVALDIPVERVLAELKKR